MGLIFYKCNNLDTYVHFKSKKGLYKQSPEITSNPLTVSKSELCALLQTGNMAYQR